MSLFIASLAFEQGGPTNARLGIFLGSLVSALAGLGWLAFVTRGRRETPG